MAAFSEGRGVLKGGKGWFAVESKTFEISIEEVWGKWRGIILERSKDFSSWIKFGEKSLSYLLEGVEDWCRGESSSRCLKVWEEGGKKFRLECHSNETGRFLLCSVRDLEAKRREGEDKVVWTASRSGVFSVKSLYSILVPGGASLFPCGSIWRANVPPKVAFFAWEASWGKILTMEQLQRRGYSLANRCVLCLSKEETVDHLLLHCVKTRALWSLLFSLFGVAWVLSGSVKETLLGWHGAFVGKTRKKAWQMAPLCIFWLVWKERNLLTFGNEVFSLQRLKYSLYVIFGLGLGC